MSTLILSLQILQHALHTIEHVTCCPRIHEVLALCAPLRDTSNAFGIFCRFVLKQLCSLRICWAGWVRIREQALHDESERNRNRQLLAKQVCRHSSSNRFVQSSSFTNAPEWKSTQWRCCGKGSIGLG